MMASRLRDRLEHILAAIAAIEAYTTENEKADFVADRLMVAVHARFAIQPCEPSIGAITGARLH